MKFLLVLVFFSLFSISVQAQERYMTLTSGGGFTGTAIVYKIHNDGTVYKGKGIGEVDFDERARLRKCATKKYFKKTRSLLADHPGFNHPGNIYSSIVLYENGSENKITWGDSAPEGAKKLYQKINASLGKLTFTQEPRK